MGHLIIVLFLIRPPNVLTMQPRPGIPQTLVPGRDAAHFPLRPSAEFLMLTERHIEYLPAASTLRHATERLFVALFFLSICRQALSPPPYIYQHITNSEKETPEPSLTFVS